MNWWHRLFHVVKTRGTTGIGVWYECTCGKVWLR
jgi:hypothetical protein